MRQRLRTAGRLPKVLAAVAALLISSGVLGFLVYREWDHILAYEWRFRWDHLAIAFVLFQIALVIAALVWADMMRVLGSSTGWGEHVRNYCFTQLARRLPGTVWYLAGRGYLYRQEAGGLRRVAAASSLELAITIISGAVVALLFGAQSLAGLSSTYVYTLGGVMVLGTVLLHPRTIHWGIKRAGLPDAVNVGYPILLRWLAGYGAVWILGGLIFFITARAITPLALIMAPFFIGAWSLIAVSSLLLLFLPSNLGFTEVGLSLLLTTVLPSGVAVSITVFARLAQYIYELLAVGVLVLGVLFIERWRNTVIG